ncbi:MAG: thiamine phosphate synthase [Acutalibacteraceae bacterium]|nr:thiamine phosphate synthase [Clostridia bacterium]MEE3449918.1 thiamine phosphate synthase [Acutalibacteraceae bacterium]
MRLEKEMLLLYAITNRKDESREQFSESIEKALQGGVTVLQLREKNISADELIEETAALKKICDTYNVPLIINDNVEIAIKCNADGVHVGADDMPVSEIRKRAGRDFIIGATAKTVEQAQKAEREGADYLGVGAVFSSPTKTEAKRITKEQLSEITKAVNIPVVAIGGIDADNITELHNTGISGVAVISALFSAEDVESRAALLKQRVKSIL